MNLRLAIGIALLGLGLAGATVENTSKGELYTRVFRVPISIFSYRSLAPEDPFASDNPSALRPKGKSFSEILKDFGIHLQKGETVFFGPATSQIVVRASHEHMLEIEKLINALIEEASAIARVQFEVYEIDTADATAATNAPSHPESLKLARKNGTLLFAPFLTTHERTAARIESGRRVEYLSGFEPENGRDKPIWKSTLVGFHLELDGRVNAGQKTVDLDLHLSFSNGEPEFGKRTVPGPATGVERMIETVQLPRHQLNTTLTALDGKPTLAGTISTKDKTYLVFLTAGVAILLSEEDTN